MNERFQVGMPVRVKAGHDKGDVLLVVKIEGDYLYLADGKTRLLEKPKKKKMKHVQLICEKYDIKNLDDVGIKRLIKLRMEKETIGGKQ